MELALGGRSLLSVRSAALLRRRRPVRVPQTRGRQHLPREPAHGGGEMVAIRALIGGQINRLLATAMAHARVWGVRPGRG